MSLAQGVTFSLSTGEGKLKDMKILKADTESGELTFIPYFAWDNRESGKMKVWVNFKEQNSLYK